MNLLKLGTRVFKIFVFAGLVILVLLMSMIALGQALKDERQLSPWGTGFFLITSGSMEPNIPVGSLILVMEVPADKIKAEDVITFFSIGRREIVTHRVREVIHDESGYVYITRGDANNVDDHPLDYERVIGRVLVSIPNMSSLTVRFQDIRFLGVTIISIGITLSIFGVLTRKKDNDK